MERTGYIVTVSCIFAATSHEDAVKQMAAWITDSAYKVGYRSENPETGESRFIDLERLPKRVMRK